MSNCNDQSEFLEVESANSAIKNKISKSLSEEQEVRIFCFDLTYYNQTTQFLCCFGGVLGLYLFYGYFQELIFTVEGFKTQGWFLTLVQFGYYICFGFVERVLEVRRLGEIRRRIPMKIHMMLAALTLGTMGLSNSSLGYLNYPIQVIFKCCKLIPVLIGSILIQGKWHGPLDFVAAFAMGIGLTWFTLADSQTAPNFNFIGILMITGALLCDAAIGNVQEKAMREHRASTSEVVLYSYGLGFVYLFLIMFLTNNFFNGLRFCLGHPFETFGYGFLFSLSGYLGIQFVLALVRSCGAPVAATVTTARKAVTITLSFIFFAKPFTFQYLWSGLIVIFGIYLNVFSKRHKFSLRDLEIKCRSVWRWFEVSSKSSGRKFLLDV